ncbi:MULTISPECIES: hypothetical protein [unclassified Streptomyces]|uniref:hypothetical protein n=1 Tax=unclassified Streptomyces TaxID=2593676 RepID=UPI003820B52E
MEGIATGAGRLPLPAPPRAYAASGEARPRLYAIDGIRLIAALMVAVHHYAGTRRVDQPGNVIWGRMIYAVALIAVAAAGAGTTWGLGRLRARLPIVRDHTWLR